MIQPFPGAAFTTASEGHPRDVIADRLAVSETLGISPEWALVRQVHGGAVMRAQGPGTLGEADALYTTRPGLPVAIAVADCVPLVLVGPQAAAAVHAGWRGLDAGVIENTLRELEGAGLAVTHAAIGPTIGPCCYEVGSEVAERFEGFVTTTTWGTPSVDLRAVARSALDGLPVDEVDACTRHEPEWHSHRGDGTTARQVAVAWLSTG